MGVTAPDTDPVLEVAAGVLHHPDGRVLVAERPEGKVLAGYLEFPGGKIEPGETARAALARELDEELGIANLRCAPLIRLTYRYPARTVRLWVFRVVSWSGVPAGREAQRLLWLDPAALAEAALLPANRPVVTALSLPETILVTPPPKRDAAGFLEALGEALAARGAGGLILRGGGSPVPPPLLAAVASLAARYEVPALLNAGGPVPVPEGFAGLHLPAAALASLAERPAGCGRVGASVHDAAQAMQARRLGFDYVLVGSVRATPSHPQRAPLGWAGFEEVAAAAGLPAYAIGGVGPGDLEAVRRRWGQGVAAIRAFWPAPAR